MNNQNALTSTAMLAAIWEREKKDTLELIMPFVKYSIGKTTSIENVIDLQSVHRHLSDDFGFIDMPYSVLQKAFKRLSKHKILDKQNHKYVLKHDLSDTCKNTDLQRTDAIIQTDTVISSLANHLNTNKEKILKKDFTTEDVKKLFVKFLETKGCFIYLRVEMLRQIQAVENIAFYHIAQFILAEYEQKSEIFSFIENIVIGLLLSQIVYGYVDTQYNEKFKDTCIYLDTKLLLHIFGFKSIEENTTASQLVKILNDNNITMKCFRHNYLEVYKIIEAYKYGLSNPSSRKGQTIEYFDEYRYSSTSVERVLSTLEDYFKEKSIEIVELPSLSNDGSGLITQPDFSSAIGESDLKEYLSKNMYYGNEEALTNDVNSISAVYTLRRGKPYSRVENCKALFVTTNPTLVKAVYDFSKSDKSVPLILSDLELTSLLWLKNNKNLSNFPTLKLIETARLSLEPTEQIRNEYEKQISVLSNESAMTEEKASAYRQLIYVEKEKIMELIDGNPDNIPRIQINELEELSRDYYNSELNNENIQLKREKEEVARKFNIAVNDRANKAAKTLEKSLKTIVYILIALFLICGIIGLYQQWKTGSVTFFTKIFLFISAVGIIDAIFSRLNFVNRIIKIISNKQKLRIIKREESHYKKL